MTKEKQQKNQQTKLKESDITKLIKDWAYQVHPKDVTLIRNNTTGILNGRGSLRKNPDSGHPDFHVIYHLAGIPITLFFEIKSPSGKVSDLQEKWHKTFDKRGIRTFVVRGVQDAENALLQIEEEFQSHIAYSYLGITRRNMRKGPKFKQIDKDHTEGVEKGKGTPEKDLTSATSKEAKIVSGSKQKTS